MTKRAKTELPEGFFSKAFQSASHALVASGVSSWNAVHAADFTEGATEAKRADCLAPPPLRPQGPPGPGAFVAVQIKASVLHLPPV